MTGAGRPRDGPRIPDRHLHQPGNQLAGPDRARADRRPTCPTRSATPCSSSLARAQITGQTVGMLKLLFHRETLEMLGIHCFGANASEIIHIGQAIMSQTGYGQFADVLHQHDVQLPDHGRSLPRRGAERLQPAVLKRLSSCDSEWTCRWRVFAGRTRQSNSWRNNRFIVDFGAAPYITELSFGPL